SNTILVAWSASRSPNSADTVNSSQGTFPDHWECPHHARSPHPPRAGTGSDPCWLATSHARLAHRAVSKAPAARPDQSQSDCPSARSQPDVLSQRHPARPERPPLLYWAVPKAYPPTRRHSHKKADSPVSRLSN